MPSCSGKKGWMELKIYTFYIGIDSPVKIASFIIALPFNMITSHGAKQFSGISIISPGTSYCEFTSKPLGHDYRNTLTYILSSDISLNLL